MTLSNRVLNILKDRDLTGCYEEKTCLYILLEFPKFQFLCAYRRRGHLAFFLYYEESGSITSILFHQMVEDTNVIWYDLARSGKVVLHSSGKADSVL